MFEGCLVESRGLGVSRTERWSAAGSALVQCAVAGLLLAIPLIHPEVLPLLMNAPTLVVPLPPRPPVPVPVTASQASASTASTPSLPVVLAPASIPTQISMGKPTGTDDPAPVSPVNVNMAGNSTGPAGLLTAANTPGPSISIAPSRKPSSVRLSSGVIAGLLLTPIQPVYPRIAMTAGIQGAVVMEATISKSGTIESLHVVSGPPMLRQAALTAVQAARYRPYLLNGEATEVQTTITVNFVMGS